MGIGIRSLALSTEALLFLVLAGSFSAAYLGRETPRRGCRPGPPALPELAGTVEVDLTLVAEDAFRLACASDTVAELGRCKLTASGAPYAGDPPLTDQTTLAPYMTSDNRLVLVPGLFRQSVLVDRLAVAPPGKPSPERLELGRFTITCALEIVGRLPSFRVRWSEHSMLGQPYDRGLPVDSAPIGRVLGCRPKASEE